MKMVIAYIPPSVMSAVVKALQDIPEVPGASIGEIRGFGRGRGQRERESLATEMGPSDTLRKLRVETMIPDEIEDKVVKTIRDAANKGVYGNGKIYVTSLERAMKIRTGEEGEEAL